MGIHHTAPTNDSPTPAATRQFDEDLTELMVSIRRTLAIGIPFARIEQHGL
jgi:hypothetical protein